MTEILKWLVENINFFCILFIEFVKKYQSEIIYGGVLGGIFYSIISGFFQKLIKFLLILIINFTKLFQTKRHKFASVQVEGAININRKFIKKVKAFGKKQKYIADDFYLAKQYKECQWYGILNYWDIERIAYKQIKEEIKTSFADKYRQSKIIALIHGRGGSGKSTLLRRLAIDSEKENFCVLWINDTEISKFSDNGISQLSNYYSNMKFLILIEDWYRIKQNTENANEIINSLCNCSNVRIVIGDRTIDKSVSKEHIFNPDENIIELHVNENKKTITKILEKVPHWKTTAEKLLLTDNNYTSTLYLILWVIARTYQTKDNILNENKIKSEGLSGHFQTIVESDLRAIGKHYSSLAKMLYYYGSVYSENKTYIGFDIFIKLADLFKVEAYSSELAFASEEIKPILEIYIHKTIGLFKSAGKLPLIAFNHDILADEGLCKAQINGWQKFDDSIKIQMLQTIINEGDGFSVSGFFHYSLCTINKENFSNHERSNYFKILFDKGNRGFFLIDIFNNNIDINETEKNKYAITILNNFLKQKYHFHFKIICHCLSQIKSLPAGKKAATDILSKDDFFKLPYSIVCKAMDISNNETVLKEATKKILSQDDFFNNLPFEIVSTAMNIVKDEKEGKEAATKILSQDDFSKIPHQIVCKAMDISNNETVLKEAATKILSQDDFSKIPHQIVCKAMDISNNETVLKEATKKILSQDDFFNNLPFEIVSTAMNIVKDEKEGKEAATKILSQDDFSKIPHQIVCKAMDISNNETVLKEAATKILSQSDFFNNLPFQIVSTAMKISKDETERKKAATDILSQPDFFKLPYQIVSKAIKISKDIDKATYFLNNWENTKWSIVFQSLFCFSETTNPQFVIDIVKSIIDSKSKGGGNYFRYSQLLKIPFHGIPLWEIECNKIINNYELCNISLFSNVLRSHRSHPDKIKKVCETVLKQWKIEIVKPIKQTYGDLHYGDNLKIALGHPDLHKLAKQTALKILDTESIKSGSIPKYLLEIVNSIIIDNKFPDWNLELNDK